MPLECRDGVVTASGLDCIDRIKRVFPWDPDTISSENPAWLRNFVNGEWVREVSIKKVINPVNGEEFILMPDTQENDLTPFVESLARCPKYGLHNPLLHPERYIMYGEVCRNAAAFLRSKEGRYFFTKLVQRVMPKEWVQCEGEVDCVARFLETFSGNSVRNLGFGTTTPGDYAGYEPRNYRWPFGPVALITPFNFPIEIMALQLLGALFMGNKVVLKQSTATSIVAEAFVRLLLDCGMPRDDILLIHCRGSVMEKLITTRNQDDELIVQMTQFTGGSDVAKRLISLTDGRVKIEDAGFDWKIIGPNVKDALVDGVALRCDKDAYAASGQKCSAQSILFAHTSILDKGLLPKIKILARKRRLGDLSVGPVLTWTNKQIKAHIDAMLGIKGANLAFGGEPLINHRIPGCYGSYEPTAVVVPLKEVAKNFKLVTTELFGPFQVIVEWTTKDDLDLILNLLNRMSNHLTAGIVDQDIDFLNHVAARTVNGTTYAGINAVTTGAPEWLHFGPSAHPAGAVIGTREGIIATWTTERMVCFNTDSGLYK